MKVGWLETPPLKMRFPSKNHPLGGAGILCYINVHARATAAMLRGSMAGSCKRMVAACFACFGLGDHWGARVRARDMPRASLHDMEHHT